jgi:hypothetical protein
MQGRYHRRCVHADQVNLHLNSVRLARSPPPIGSPSDSPGNPHKQSEKIIMSTVTYNDQDFDFETVFHSMDKDLTTAIQGTVETDQEFFDTYLAAHAEKHGERFIVL